MGCYEDDRIRSKNAAHTIAYELFKGLRAADISSDTIRSIIVPIVDPSIGAALELILRASDDRDT